MDPDTAIQHAVELGVRQGLDSLSGVQRQVFAISESERYCDGDGIDALIHRYGVSTVSSFADAFDAVGATEVASALQELPALEPIPESLLTRATMLIAERRGYTYESLEVLMRQDERELQSVDAASINPYFFAAAWFLVGCVQLIGVIFGFRVLSHLNPFEGFAISLYLFLLPAILFALLVYFLRRLPSGRCPPPENPNQYAGAESSGYCPNCSTLIPIASAGCPHCRAQFGVTAAWHIFSAEEYGARNHEKKAWLSGMNLALCFWVVFVASILLLAAA